MVLWQMVSQHSGVACQAQPATPTTVTTHTRAMMIGRRFFFQSIFFFGVASAVASVLSLISSAIVYSSRDL